MNTPEFDERIERLIEGTLDETGRNALLAELRADPEKRRHLSRQLEITEALSRLGPARDDDRFVRHLTEHAISLHPPDGDAFVERLNRRITRREWSRRAAIAAAFTLATTGAIFVWRKQGVREEIATLTEIDENGTVRSSRAVVPGFAHRTRSGLLRLNFRNGAVVAIEGPTDFHVESGMLLRLRSGRLNAWCPETAHGFQVATATGTVTDLGTSFGVSTAPDGTSDYVVLDGLIEVNRGKETRRLEKGMAVRTAATGIHSTEFSGAPFERTWPLASGILATSGNVRPAPPGTAEQLSKLEDNDAVLVIPEKRDVEFDRPILAELLEPGSFPAGGSTQPGTLSPEFGKRLRAFLVRYNPSYSNDFRVFTGEVTFDRPVLAICCQGKFLDETDAMFANGDYSDVDPEARKFRGIDLDQPLKYPDKVTLSADRRTVAIEFRAGVSSDDIRVILAEEY